jgi:hypothetical protein
MAHQRDPRAVAVERTNGDGFKANGEWLTFSTFSKPDDLPMVGERVVVSRDKAGFVRKVETVTPPATAPARALATPEGTPRASVAPVIVQDARGIVVSRLAVLNTAATILSSGGRVAEADADLALAGKLEAWATQGRAGPPHEGPDDAVGRLGALDHGHRCR